MFSNWHNTDSALFQLDSALQYTYDANGLPYASAGDNIAHLLHYHFSVLS